MELRTLRYFLAVASEKNITRAAELLHVTQPTLSRQMSDLERELGTTLFLRGKRALTLTEDGLLFRQRAEDIVELADRAEREFTQRTSVVGGIITLGVVESLSAVTLARLVKEFSHSYPEVQFTLYNGMADTLRESVDQGTLDLALVLEPVDTTKYEFLRLPQRNCGAFWYGRTTPLPSEVRYRCKSCGTSPCCCPPGPAPGGRSSTGWAARSIRSTFGPTTISSPIRFCWWRRGLVWRCA